MSDQQSRGRRRRRRSGRTSPPGQHARQTSSQRERPRETISPDMMQEYLEELRRADAALEGLYPGEPDTGSPVHTFYGGAHLFHADTPAKLGVIALRSLQSSAPDFVAFAGAIELEGFASLPSVPSRIRSLAKAFEQNEARERMKEPTAWLAWAIYQRVLAKLRREPVEDFRIDFEDGYGVRKDAEEDDHAIRSAHETAIAMKAKSLPRFFGIRIKPFQHESAQRSIRTADLYCSILLGETRGTLPDNFVVTLPKVTSPEQVAVLADLLDDFESHFHLAPGTIGIELMIETPFIISDYRGASALPLLVEAADHRCTSVHFGPYDFTASLDIAAPYQQLDHPVCDIARGAMKIALAGTGVRIVDGPTTILPVDSQRSDPGRDAKTGRQGKEHIAGVHSAWRRSYRDIRRSISFGIYQGWDIHPAQLPVRYAAHAAFYLEGLTEATKRLSSYFDQSGRPTVTGELFDDAATVRGLLNFFSRGFRCGALTADNVRSAGLTTDELDGRNPADIIAARQQSHLSRIPDRVPGSRGPGNQTS